MLNREVSSNRYIFQPAPPISVPILGDDQRFPVRRVFCVGRNYAEHAKEMGASPERGQRPVFFTKPADAVLADGQATRYPSATANLHFEVELVVALHSGGENIATEQALSHVFGYAVGTSRCERNPASELKGVLRKPNEKHFPAITDPVRLGELLRACDSYKGTQIVRSALHLLPILFVRPGELRHAEWGEIDLDAGLWIIPAGKMKMPRSTTYTQS